MTAAEASEIEASADFEHFNVEGTVTVEWPEVKLEFNMNKFAGEYESMSEYIILSCNNRQNISLCLRVYYNYRSRSRLLETQRSANLL